MLIDEVRNGESASLEFKRDVPNDALEMMMSGHSRSRNRALALTFRYMRFIESWGSGIPRIQTLLAEHKLRPLTVEDNGSDMRFVIWRPNCCACSQQDDTVLSHDGAVGRFDSTVLSHNGTPIDTVKTGDVFAGWTLKELPSALQRLVMALQNDTLGSRQLCERLRQKSRGALIQTYIRPAIKLGLVEVIGEKTHSSKRAYRIKTRI